MSVRPGPPPKPADRRARRNKDPIPTRVFEVLPGEAYPLPDDLLPADEEWHPATRRWWTRWCNSPLTADLPEVDWCELEVAAVIHHRFMKKPTFALAAELRQRVAAFGGTPVDRARLRYQIAIADREETARDMEPPRKTAKKQYGGLAVIK